MIDSLSEVTSGKDMAISSVGPTRAAATIDPRRKVVAFVLRGKPFPHRSPQSVDAVCARHENRVSCSGMAEIALGELHVRVLAYLEVLPLIGVQSFKLLRASDERK